ncbi:MAG: DUF1648 domain-containing protein [Clostridiales bacterium]|nr:DUF1648 domain-containing protein [Clostridiales bacterium]
MRTRLPFSLIDQILEALALLIFLGAMVYLAVIWRLIPESIPTHYNTAGAANAWGGKGWLIFIYAINAATYILMTVVGFFPGIWNVPVKLTPENTGPVLTRTRRFLCVIKLYVVAMFGYLAVMMAKALPIGMWFLPVFLILLFGTIAGYMIRLRRFR